MAGVKQGSAQKPFRVAKLYVQAIDAYGFQRELSVQRLHVYNPDTGKTSYVWEMHVYAHPGRRNRYEVSEAQAKGFISAFLSLCERYPDLLFNSPFWRESDAKTPANVRPVSAGFVTLCERLHRGASLAESLP